MAVVRLDGARTGVNLSLLDVGGLLDFDAFKMSTVALQLYDDARNCLLFSGSGLRYRVTGGTIDQVTAGTISALSLVESGVTRINITGLNASAVAMFDLVRAGNDQGFINLLLSGNDMITGTPFADTISGGAGSDSVSGGDGNDTLYGEAGDDILYGDAGNDTLRGATGNDKLYGGTGDDTLFGEAGNDTLDGCAGNDRLYGGEGTDILRGGAGNDILYGEAGNDTLYGDAGNDKLYGGVGNDKLYGGAGNDVLYGENGDDTLNGGAGADQLYGGGGRDTFVFTSVTDSTPQARDTIYGFATDEKIDLRGIDANVTVANDQVFTFIGSRAFSGHAGELRAVTMTDSSGTFIYADTDGDRLADFVVRLDVPITLTAGHFLL